MSKFTHIYNKTQKLIQAKFIKKYATSNPYVMRTRVIPPGELVCVESPEETVLIELYEIQSNGILSMNPAACIEVQPDKSIIVEERSHTADGRIISGLDVNFSIHNQTDQVAKG